MMIHFSYLGHNYIFLVHKCSLLFCHLCISQAYYITNEPSWKQVMVNWIWIWHDLQK